MKDKETEEDGAESPEDAASTAVAGLSIAEDSISQVSEEIYKINLVWF